MTPQNQHPEHPSDSHLPKPLAGELAALYKPPSEIPAEIDENILFAARQQFGDTRRSWRWGGVGIVAAAIMLIFLIQHTLQPQRSILQPDTPPPLAIREDIDLSGRVDILDAFALARHLKAGAPTRAEWDINQDGSINQADVDAVAMTAVQLNGGAS